jgi:predicted ArsR family transcriptional regulator
MAERKGLLIISKEIILESSKLIDSVKLSEKIHFLSKEEITVLNVLEDGICTGEIYSKLDIPQRSIRRYLENLEKINLIRFEDITGNKGRTRKIFLNFDKSLI